jgi:hypothetical protein
MRCMACGAVMHLIQVHPAEDSMGPGFEHHTFECSECKDVERRLLFTSPSAPRAEPIPVDPAAASSVSSAARGAQPDTDHALLRNAWEMLRGGWRKSP